MRTISRKRNLAAQDRHHARRVSFELLEDRRLLSASSMIVLSPLIELSSSARTSSVQGLTPSQVQSAYSFNKISLGSSITGTGAGQTIAIVDAYKDPNIAADLATFDSQFGLSAAQLTIVNQTGGSVSSVKADQGWAAEIALDVEWAHAMAPGAKILLVETNSDGLNDLMAGVNYARNAAGVSVVSMSWGGSEFLGETAYDKYFTTPAGHQGVTFIAASGDSGSMAGAQWPASSPNVLSVGGTSLSVSSSGTIQSETGWVGSSGGSSAVESKPSYQSAISGSTRSSPDVSYNADPNTGFAVYDSYGSGGWSVVGGTSAGAPQWAALIAIADQGRALAGKSTLDGASGTLPSLYKLYSAAGTSGYATYTQAFNDITSGGGFTFGGGFGGFGFGGFRGRGGAPITVGGASAGYDQVTGLGSPVANVVVSALVGASSSSSSSSSSKTTASRVGHSGVRVGRTIEFAATAFSENDAIALPNELAITAAALAQPRPLTPINARPADGTLFASASIVISNDSVGMADPILSDIAAGDSAKATSHATNSMINHAGPVSVADDRAGLETGLMTLGNLAGASNENVARLSLAQIDASLAMSDAMAAFASDAASLATTFSDTLYSPQWAVVMLALAAEAIILGRWMAPSDNRRPRQRSLSAAHAPSGTWMFGDTED